MKFIVFRSNSFISKVIRWQTRGNWSHVACLFSDGVVIESREFKGVRKLNSLAEAQSVGDTVQVLTLSCKPEQEEKMRRFAESQLGRPYDYLGILRFLTRTPDTDQYLNRDWFCSGFAFEVAKMGGIELFRDTEEWEVSPEMFARSAVLTT